SSAASASITSGKPCAERASSGRPAKPGVQRSRAPSEAGCRAARDRVSSRRMASQRSRPASQSSAKKTVKKAAKKKLARERAAAKPPRKSPAKKRPSPPSALEPSAKAPAPQPSAHPVRRLIASDAPLVERLRKLCLALPEANERLSHGEPTWFAGKGKVFAMLDNHHHGSPHLSVWLPQPEGAQEALIEADPARFFRPP